MFGFTFEEDLASPPAKPIGISRARIGYTPLIWVRPLKVRTRDYDNPVHLVDLPYNRTDKNQLNWPVFNGTGEPTAACEPAGRE